MSLEKIKKINFFEKFFLRLPIKIRLTIWYSFFIIILFFSIIAIGFYLEDKFINDSKTEELIEGVEKILYKPEKFKSFNNGIYFLKYDNNNAIIEGRVPNKFDSSLPFSIEDINVFKNSKTKFLYYDVKINENGEWVRGIFPITIFERELLKFLYILLFLTPFIIFLIVYGGYKIVKKGFLPIKSISETTEEITKKQNFSKRIDLFYAKDEVSALANTLNEMLDTVENSFIREKQFTADVSHELRTPLTVILSESEYALKYSDTFEEAKDSLKVIERQSKKMKELINQIMELSKLDIKKEIDKENFDISNTFTQILEDYNGLIKEKGIELNKDIQQGLTFYGNKIMIERVFINILNNSIKFTKNKIDVFFYLENDKLILKIKDNGIGISKENIKKVWNRFFQVESSRNKDENKGSGLGLSMVKKILELHSAKVEIKSELNKSTEFIITF